MDSLNIRCVVIDDEPLAIEKLRGFVAKVPYLQLVASFQSGIEAIPLLKSEQVDLLFLDIQMEDLTGIQLLEVLKNKPCVIFTTAYSEYAVKGYELDICDYLLKPISFERFMLAVNKIVDKLTMKPASETMNQRDSQEIKPVDFMLVKADYHMQKISFDDILFMEGMKDYIRIHTPEKRVMTLQTFKNMEEILPADQFCRIHKSFIVSLRKIEKIERNQVIIKGERIPIGETYRKTFFDLMKKLGIIH
jgi:two-component system, LytTR family, response regulator